MIPTCQNQATEAHIFKPAELLHFRTGGRSARGDMENRIKEQQLDLYADRTSTQYMDSNQLRLWFATFAYFLIERIRTLSLKDTQLAKATAGTIRLKLFKIAANLTVSLRRIYIRLASACPMREVFEKAHQRLMALGHAFA